MWSDCPEPIEASAGQRKMRRGDPHVLVVLIIHFGTEARAYSAGDFQPKDPKNVLPRHPELLQGA
jgi:hypothetical protein